MSEALHDSNLEADAVVGVVFEWLAAVAEVTDDDHHYLAIRQVTASGLKTHVMALVDAPDPKRAALLLLSAFERRLYQREGGDPFRTSA